MSTAAAPRRLLMLLANGFHPDPRVHKEACSLIAAGFEVTILCLDRDENLAPEDQVDGIRLHRLRAGRVRAGAALSVGRALLRFARAASALARRLHAERPFHAVHCHDFDTAFFGLRLARRLGVPGVYDMHDLYSSFFTNPVLERAVGWLDARACRAASGMIVVNDRFLDLPAIDPAQTEVVMNAPLLAGSERCEVTSEGLFYAGNFDASRDMRYALEPITESGLSAHFAGDGPLLEEHRRRAAGEPKITFLGRIPPAEVFERTRRSLAVLALYDPVWRNNRLASPNKLFEAMKYGKPTIASDDTVMAEIIRQHDCGLVVRYGDPQSLAEALEALRQGERYARLAANAHAAFLRHYHWEIMADRLLRLYDGLLGRSQAGTTFRRST